MSETVINLSFSTTLFCAITYFVTNLNQSILMPKFKKNHLIFSVIHGFLLGNYTNTFKVKICKYGQHFLPCE